MTALLPRINEIRAVIDRAYNATRRREKSGTKCSLHFVIRFYTHGGGVCFMTFDSVYACCGRTADTL